MSPEDRTMKTIGIGRFDTQPTVKNFARRLQESKLSECELNNRILINVQQLCYISEFKNNHEVYTRSIIFANEIKKYFG